MASTTTASSDFVPAEFEDSAELTPKTVGYVDLKKLFPCSKRKALRRSIGQLMFFLLALVACILADFLWVSEYQDEQFQDLVHWAMLALIAGSFCYWVYCYRMVKWRGRCLRYFIQDGSLMVRKGIFLKKSGTFHLTRITDVFVDQDRLDWLFGVGNIMFSTAHEQSCNFAIIDALDIRQAQRFQEYMLNLVEFMELSKPAQQERSVTGPATSKSSGKSVPTPTGLAPTKTAVSRPEKAA